MNAFSFNFQEQFDCICNLDKRLKVRILKLAILLSDEVRNETQFM